MADTSSRLQRLALSAADLKEVTKQQKSGEPWPDALIEDYLNILRDLVQLADLIDENAEQTILNIQRVSQLLQVDSAKIGKLFAIGRELARVDKNSMQELQSMLGKVRSLSRDVFEKSKNYYQFKGCMVRLIGAALVAPTIVSSYNVTDVQRLGVGDYLVTIDSDSFFGIDIAASGFPSCNWNIATSAATEVFTVEIQLIASGVIYFKVFEVKTAAGALLKTPYDFLSTDTITIMMSLSGGALTPPL